MTRPTASLFVGLVVSLLSSTMGWAEPEFPAVLFEQPSHFTAPDGTDMLIAAGTYRVEQAAGTNLRLVTEAPPATREISATSFTHEESLTAPLAFAAREENQEEAVHLLFLLPSGQGLDATRRMGDVQTRGLDGISRLIAITQTKSDNANDEALSGADKQRTLVMEQRRLRSAQQSFEDKLRTTTPFDSQMRLKRCDYCKLLQELRK